MKLVVRPELSTFAQCPLINRGLLFKRTEPLLMVVVATVVGVWFAVGQKLSFVPLLLGLVLAAVGLWDDLRHLPAKARFVVQIAIVIATLPQLCHIPSMNLPFDMIFSGWFLRAALVLAGMWWINLFNFMDGIDGIASAQAICMLGVAAILVAWMQPAAVNDPLWLFAVCIAAATLGFLLLNWPPAKIFMGDVGSTWLAFMIFVVALLTVQRGWMGYATWLVLAAVFVIDATATLLTRIAQGERCYEAHRSHAYQRLSRRWQGDRKAGHRSVTLLVTGVNLMWLAPLAAATLLMPHYSWAWVAVAYLPISAVVLRLGAGRPDNA